MSERIEPLPSDTDDAPRIAPPLITDLHPDEIFVFGSNDKGAHCGRASKTAFLNFGAKMGKPEGISGNSYAIPTTHLTTHRAVVSEILKSGEYRTERSRYGKLKYLKEEISRRKGKYRQYSSETQKKTFDKAVARFISFAGRRTDLTFYVTRVGCGYRGYSDEEVAPKFREARHLKNVYLPQSFIDVLDDTRRLRHPSELVPSPSGGITTFESDLDSRLSKYTNWLRTWLFDEEKNLFPNPGKRDKHFHRRHIMDDVENISGRLCNAVMLYLKGLPSNAYSEIETIMETINGMKRDSPKNKKSSNMVLQEEGGDGCRDVFFRMRVEKDKTERDKVGLEGMFHLGRSLRGKVSTQRFSISGYPCLYLGKSVFGCWKENAQPDDLSQCLVSKYVVENRSYKVLDLCIPKTESWYDFSDEDRLKRQILLFPLVIASTFRTPKENRGDSFKPEYIIPQLLLQWVKEQAYMENRTKRSDSTDRIVYGIKYTSVHLPAGDEDGAEEFTPDKYVNYVFPVIDIKDEHCSVLGKMFTISRPVPGSSVEGSRESPDGRYEDTVFGKLEASLAGAELFRMGQTDNSEIETLVV